MLKSTANTVEIDSDIDAMLSDIESRVFGEAVLA